MFEVIILYIYKSAQSNYIKEASKVDANSRYNISIWTIFANFFFLRYHLYLVVLLLCGI
jgi:hypothetical protein